ncbi:Cerato-platanin-domain-containing protein [Chiua virens]|nr:Cerato-platanin-domain-containing protein [Chiua virens]
MKFIFSLVILSAAVLPSLAQSGTAKVTYVGLYDNPDWPLDSTACSNGDNGLDTKWPTLGDIPGYPLVAGIPGLTWNSPSCGTCWELSYVNDIGVTHTVTVTAVDAAYTFNLAKSVFMELADASAVQAGFFEATAAQIPCPYY